MENFESLKKRLESRLEESREAYEQRRAEETRRLTEQLGELRAQRSYLTSLQEEFVAVEDREGASEAAAHLRAVDRELEAALTKLGFDPDTEPGRRVAEAAEPPEVLEFRARVAEIDGPDTARHVTLDLIHRAPFLPTDSILSLHRDLQFALKAKGLENADFRRLDRVVRDAERVGGGVRSRLDAEMRKAAQELARSYQDSVAIDQQIDELRAHVEENVRHLAQISKGEVTATLKMLAGQARALQDRAVLNPDREKRFRVVFGIINTAQKNSLADYIEALNRNYSTNWESYTAAAKDSLMRASEAERRRLAAIEAERGARVREKEEAEKALRDLARIDRTALPEKGTHAANEICTLVQTALVSTGVEDPRLPEAVDGLEPLLTGRRFKALRAEMNWPDLDAEKEKRKKDEPTPEAEESIDEETRRRVEAYLGGKTIALVGGNLRELAREKIEQTFRIKDLKWVEFEKGSGVGKILSLKESIRNGGTDVVILLKFSAHKVTEALRPIAREHAVPYIVVPQGYGIRQIANAVLQHFEPRAYDSHSVNGAED